MAKNRYVDTRFWHDTFIREHLNPLDRYLFLYFLTNDKTNIAGIYELPMSIISNETGIEQETLSKMFTRFVGKIYYLEGWVYIRNFQKYQNVKSPKVQIGIDNEMSKIPKHILDKIDKINKNQIGYAYGIDTISHLNSNSNLNSNLNPNPNTKPSPKAPGVNFEEFWKIYPKKVDKKKAKAKWDKLSFEVQNLILQDIPKRKLGEKWLKEGGRFIENSTTYLNGERWEDVIVEPIEYVPEVFTFKK